MSLRDKNEGNYALNHFHGKLDKIVVDLKKN